MTAGNDIFKAILVDTSPFIVKGGWFLSNHFITHVIFLNNYIWEVTLTIIELALGRVDCACTAHIIQTLLVCVNLFNCPI